MPGGCPGGMLKLRFDWYINWLREIKRLCREEPKSFKRKGNEIQYKFNSKLPDTLEEAKSHLEINRSLAGGPSWSIPA